ncbi:uncharacterized protein Bfra_003600 [Botrytis fragariae]|uniref:Uncharacterized protein n=1 Tax=Botrytis fragariae TaxID=1964551 RepID=A0A8H6EK25_9HELO|nr:uncharacterized protein Bfra_003600 [Botrytis fragariae]KAF5875147.1 hypothetical protein Bfra_003600 [Botrytis fragariae]
MSFTAAILQHFIDNIDNIIGMLTLALGDFLSLDEIDGLDGVFEVVFMTPEVDGISRLIIPISKNWLVSIAWYGNIGPKAMEGYPRTQASSVWALEAYPESEITKEHLAVQETIARLNVKYKPN